MPKIDSKLAFIIPTKNRPEDLCNFLKSVRSQEIWPSQIIIVDAGDLSLEDVISDFRFFNITYMRHKPPSLSVQRNIGLKLLKRNIEIVAFFDDDIELCLHTIDIVMEFWRKATDDIVGVACNIIDHPKKKVMLLEKLFLLGSDSVGVILPSGFQSMICSVDNNYQVQWVMGGATFWRHKVFNSYKFDEWFYGYAHCEDIDFSYQLSKKYRLFVLKNAKVLHKTNLIEKENEYHLGKMQVINRVYFVKKHAELSLILCYWACTGLFLKNIFWGTFGLKTRYLLRGFGILIGMITSFIELKRIREEIKL